MLDQLIEKAARLALCPAMFLGLGELFFEMLLSLFVGFFVGMVVRCLIVSPVIEGLYIVTGEKRLQCWFANPETGSDWH